MAFDLLSDTEILVAVSVIEDENGPATTCKVKFSDLNVSMDVKRDLKHKGVHTYSNGVFKTIYSIVDREYDLDNSKLYVYRNETRIQTFNGWQHLYTGLFFLANWYQKDFRDLSTYTFDELILNLRRNGVVDFTTGASTEKVTISTREISTREISKFRDGNPLYNKQSKRNCQHCGDVLGAIENSDTCTNCFSKSVEN